MARAQGREEQGTRLVVILPVVILPVVILPAMAVPTTRSFAEIEEVEAGSFAIWAAKERKDSESFLDR
jgi:hypothetical protein